MKTRTFDVRVAGVTFNGRQEILGMLDGGEPCRIVPEPDNPHDKNALAVYVAKNGEVFHIGYIPKDIAAVIAPFLDGEAVVCSGLQITGGFQTHAGETANFGARLLIDIPLDPEHPQNLQLR